MCFQFRSHIISVSLSVYLSLSVYPSICLSVCLSICPSLSPSLSSSSPPRQAHIRFARATPNHVLRFAARPQMTNTSFLPAVRQIFGKNLVLDPSDFFVDSHPQTSLCVPRCLALTLFVGLDGAWASTLNRAQLNAALRAINFTTVLKRDGISLADFKKFEELNSPFPPTLLSLFPELSAYKGLKVSIFRAKVISEDQGTSKESKFFLFPKFLSSRHSDPELFPLDLLLDSSSLRVEGASTGKPAVKGKSLHVLAITSLVKLASLRNPLTKSKAHTFQHVCRRCLRTFRLEDEMRNHSSVCKAFPTCRPFQARRALNTRYFSPFYLNRFTRKMEPRFTKFKLGRLFTMLTPVSTVFYDMEALSIPIDSGKSHGIGQAPVHSTKEQVPLSFALKSASNYPNHPLPQPMRECRVIHLTDHTRDDIVRQFYLDVLLTIRASLEHGHAFMMEALSRDPGTPSLSQLPPDEQLRHLTSSRCALCGHFYSERNPGISRRPLRRTVHHHHLLADARSNTASICNICNLSLMSQYNSRVAHILIGQNSAHYDHMFILTAAMVAGKTLVPIISKERGGEVIGHTPILKGNPRLLLKDISSILSIDLRFQCVDGDCQKHLHLHTKSSRARIRRQLARKSKLRPSCIYSRLTSFHDACLMTSASLSAKIDDLVASSEADKVPLSVAFKHTYEYAESLGLSPENCDKFVR